MRAFESRGLDPSDGDWAIILVRPEGVFAITSQDGLTMLDEEQAPAWRRVPAQGNEWWRPL